MTPKASTGGITPREGDIAIVGIGCRFPGESNDPQSFWNMLVNGVDAITEIPPERWDVEAWYDPRPGIAGRTYARHGGFVTGIDQFDAEFFGLSRREAERMDPQQRMLLEAAWEALEDGGIRLDTARAGVGVFVGISTNDYAMVQTGLGDFAGIDIFTPTGGAFSIAANRISHLLDLGGPSVAVDTACSSALTAVHLAVRALRAGDCRVALAGGVNALLLPTNFVAFSRMSMLSPDGRCKAFDASANGFVRGEGVGLLALEQLAAAQAAGRRILAVIRATGANQDAHTSSLTVPSAAAQEALVRAACREAGFHPATVDYVEAHGTGTAVGDPTEAAALSAALAQARPAGQPLAIGSVKSNIGHLEAGAGAAGLIKATLALHHATIPPSLHFRSAPETIDLATLNLEVVTAPRPLPSTPTRPARVAVNSFGFGGANAHAMLQSAPPRLALPTPRDPGAALLMLPARSSRRLVAVARRWHDFLAPGGDGATLELADVCHTAASRRNTRGLGVAVLAEGHDALLARLSALAEGQETVAGVVNALAGAKPPRPVFVYSGQGTQWWAMGRELLGREPVFDAAIDECDALFAALGDWSLRAELTRPEAESRLDNTAFAQPAIFALQVALTRLWAAWGVHPAACVGHSVGEVAAAWATGVLDLPTAARVIFHRGACMDATPHRGRMLAVALTEAEARQLVSRHGGRVSLGAVNSPGMVTLSGDGDALEAITADLAARGLFHRFLQVQYAFHSAHMDPVEGPLAAALGTVAVHSARLPLVSTVTAEPVAKGDYDASYWWRNVREAVLFGPAITRLAEQGFDCFLEVGAHPALAAPIVESARAADLRPQVQPLVLASLRRGSPERPALLEALGALAVRGHAVSWDGVLGGARQPVELPREVWHRDRYWHDSESWIFERGAYLRHPLIDRRLPGAEPAWELQLDIRRLTWLEDHRVHGHVVFPAAGYIDMMLGAAQDLGEGGIILEDVDFQRMLTLPTGETSLRMELRHRPADGTLEIFSREGQGDWVRNVVGSLRRAAVGRTPGRLCPETLAARLDEDLDPEALNAILATTGLQFGPVFRGLREIRRRDGEALGRITPADNIVGDLAHHVAHAGLLDPCMQLAVAAVPRDARVMGDTFLPVQMRRLWLHRPLRGPLVAHVSRVMVNGRFLDFDIAIADESGEILAQLDGYRVQAFPPKQAQSRQRAGNPRSDDWLHRQIWFAAPRPETPVAATELAPLTDVAEAARRIGARDLAAGSAWGDRHAHDRDFVAATTDWITAALGTLGWRYRRGQRLDAGRIATDLGIVPAHRRLLDRFVSFLVADGVLVPEADGSLRVAASLSRRDPYLGWRRMVARQPRLMPELTLIRQVGARLADILRGQADPLEVLFPEGRSGPLEHLYQSGLSLITANTMVAEAVSTALAALPPGRRLRVLEIGAGTGGLTSHLLPRLPAAGTRYLFTDISRVFFARAERAFYEHRCVEFATLDIGRCQQIVLVRTLF